MPFNTALELVKTEVANGFLLDFYTTPTSIIAISDQGEYVFWPVFDGLTLSD
jgi:hypothetical protein